MTSGGAVLISKRCRRSHWRPFASIQVAVIAASKLKLGPQSKYLINCLLYGRAIKRITAGGGGGGGGGGGTQRRE